MTPRIVIPGAALALAAAATATATATAAPAPAWGHGGEIAPLVQPSSPRPAAGDTLLVPLVPPLPSPPPDDLEIAPLIPKKPAPMIEIIRWKKKKVTRPKYPNYSARQQTFHAYLAAEQSAILRWNIAGLQPEPGLCTGAGSSTVVYFSSRRPVLVSAAGRSMESISVPVNITFASTVAHVPDRNSCLNLQPSNECRLDARNLPGTATLSTRGNGTVVRYLYLSSLTIDPAKAGSACVDGLFGFPDILGIDSGAENAAIPWGAVNSRSGRNVNIGRSYGTAGTQAEGSSGCSTPSEGYTCSYASITKWNLRLIRAKQVRVRGVR
jgi:hypothetical protein